MKGGFSEQSLKTPDAEAALFLLRIQGDTVNRSALAGVVAESANINQDSLTRVTEYMMHLIENCRQLHHTHGLFLFTDLERFASYSSALFFHFWAGQIGMASTLLD